MYYYIFKTFYNINIFITNIINFSYDTKLKYKNAQKIEHDFACPKSLSISKSPFISFLEQ